MSDHVPSKTAQRGFSWTIAVLLLLCLFINYLDRQTLSVLVRFLPPELAMSNVTYGTIQSLFLLAYALAMPFAGWTIDRLGTRTGLAITVAIWSLVEFLHGTATSVRELGMYRFLLGMPEAAGLPAVSKVAAEHAAPHARATFIGIAMFGLGMGSTLAPPVVAYLSLTLSWRWAFYGTGLAGFVWIAAWLLFYRPEPRRIASHAPEVRTPWVTLLRDRRVVGLMAARAFADSIWWFYLFWIPPFLNQARGMDLHQMGLLGWIPYFFASIGSVVGGYASGRLVRRGWAPVQSRKTIMWICAGIVPFTSLVVHVQSVAGVLAVLAVATFFIQGFFANVFSLPADLFPHERVASVFGLCTMVGTLGGLLTVNMAGHVVERFSYVPLFVAVAFFLPLSACAAQLLANPREQEPEAAAVV